MLELKEIMDATIVGDLDKTVAEIDQALNNGAAPGDIIQNALIKAMDVVGEKFKNNEIYMPEMLVAARAMKAGLSKLKPLMVGDDVETLARVVLGTVKGDLHDIGKNLVGIMLEGAGCEVIDVGVDVSPEDFVGAIETHRPQFIGLSALLTTTMPALKLTLDTLENAGVRRKVNVLIGGAPVTQKFADQIGADGYADNAAAAVDKIRELVKNG